MTVLVTGGAGFIGSNFILDWLDKSDEKVINLDKLTYAGNLENLKSLKKNKNYTFEHGDICNAKFVNKLLKKYSPSVIINFAAESHVDRSITSPDNFIHTNIVGTYNLLESTRIYCNTLDNDNKSKFRFIQISTDEIYGSLSDNAAAFTETDRIKPNSPYSASKASSDHLIRAWYKTYDLPVITSNCSNNYGPFQFPEKLIPLTIVNALRGKAIPIYGDGLQIRDWLYVKDHCAAIRSIIKFGKIGEVYNIGGSNEVTNIDVVNSICDILDKKRPMQDNKSYRDQITFIKDRLGHDRRYAINASKIERDTGWKPTETFDSGIQKTIDWYLNNEGWINHIHDESYLDWINEQYS
tara:strand:- start:24 stop:1082 length:1059 start_codon:yes stop_codon:yes gene_type:complete